MEIALLVFLIILANLTLYWIFWGKRKFEEKFPLEPAETLPKAGEKLK